MKTRRLLYLTAQQMVATRWQAGHLDQETGHSYEKKKEEGLGSVQGRIKSDQCAETEQKGQGDELLKEFPAEG